jgi:transposase-like protein
MIKSDLICPQCKAGYRRIELKSKPWTVGKFRCLACDQVLETFDGSANVAFRLTVQPVKRSKNGVERRPRRPEAPALDRVTLAPK